jgi:hypothetical protein
MIEACIKLYQLVESFTLFGEVNPSFSLDGGESS